MDLDYETIRLLQEEFQHEFCSPPKVNLSDSIIARQLQEQFEQEISAQNSRSSATTNLSDSLLARKLHEQFQQEEAIERPTGNLVYKSKNKNREDTKSLVDPSWEVIDPTPDVHVLFITFNKKFFWGKLDAVCVSWSKRMKRCAGICSYQGRAGMCHIALSEPLLKLRPRKDLIETLLHEMIHAYLFVTHNNRDRDGHGPEFHKHMYRINGEAGTNITVYHDFHDEVDLYLQHWWRCNGQCQKWKPYFGIIRRSVNRAPGPTDRWWGEHSRNCGGTFNKIKSPEPKTKGMKNANPVKNGKENKPLNDIRKYIPNTKSTAPSDNRSSTSGNYSNIHTISKPTTGLAVSVAISSKTNNIHGFSNSTSKTCGGTCAGQKGAVRNSNTIVITKKPSTVVSNSSKSSEIKLGTNKPTTLSNEKKENISSKTPENYAIVRNFWVNKFPNTATSNSSTISNKRKSSENLTSVSKSPKLSNTYSQDSLDCERVPCPICNVSYLIEEVNGHLDKCLNDSKNNEKECIVCMKTFRESDYQNHLNECLKTNFEDDVFNVSDSKTDGDRSLILIEEGNRDVNIINNEKECFVCLKNFRVSEYQNHLNDCLKRNFEDDVFEISDSKNDKDRSLILVEESNMHVNKINCAVCRNDVMINDMDNHVKICRNRSKCPECDETIDPDLYNAHLAECLIKKLDNMNERYNKKKDEKIKKSSSIAQKEMIDCLACGKNILKSELNCHLDECLNEVFQDEKSSKNSTDNDDKMYNCPFCLKLVSEVGMNDHIDICLKIVDEDNEMEVNKSIFLSEMD